MDRKQEEKVMRLRLEPMLVRSTLKIEPEIEIGLKPMTQLVQQYFEVIKCWNDHAAAVSRGMSVERAIHLLREIRDTSKHHLNGELLARKADELLWDIVDLQADGNID